MILYYSCNWKVTWMYFNHIMHKEFTSRQTAFTLSFFILKSEDDCKFTKSVRGVKPFKNTVFWSTDFPTGSTTLNCDGILKAVPIYQNQTQNILTNFSSFYD